MEESKQNWSTLLKEEFQSSYFLDLQNFLAQESLTATIFPPRELILNAFRQTPYPKVKVVIIGQDPYHEPGQAHGLAFSVPDGIAVPKSLINIYKEIHDDLGIDPPKGGNLIPWARQGVLLLNAVLTVRAHAAGSHRNRGWETFTNNVIRKLSDQKEHLVFLLWGSYAKEKMNLIDVTKHRILTAAHPSPLSAYNGFFGCRHFSQTNAILQEWGEEPIAWGI